MSAGRIHRHWCELAGHDWDCEGYALRTFSGRTYWTKCVCICGTAMTTRDHRDCPIELLPCPEHLAESLITGSEIQAAPDP
jgi:hypothetical protein